MQLVRSYSGFLVDRTRPSLLRMLYTLRGIHCVWALPIKSVLVICSGPYEAGQLVWSTCRNMQTIQVVK